MSEWRECGSRYFHTFTEEEQHSVRDSRERLLLELREEFLKFADYQRPTATCICFGHFIWGWIKPNRPDLLAKMAECLCYYMNITGDLEDRE